MTDKDLRLISINKTKDRVEQYGNGVYLVIALSVGYIDSDMTLRNILCLSKMVNSKVRNAVYKQALLYSEF